MIENKNIYVGNRYVPKIIGEWDSQEPYEGLSIVTFEGTSYTSKKGVPVGVNILNEDYWVVTGNYNAQIENYRQEVKKNSEDLTEYKGEVTTLFAQKVGVFVESYGAVGDGITDDTMAIQNCLDNEDHVLFEPKKIYMINRTDLKPESNQFINLNGATLKMIPNSNTHSNIFNLYQKENITIINGKLIGDLGEHFHEATGKAWKIWKPSTTFLSGDLMTTQSSFGYECIVGGTSGNKLTSESDELIVDGDITWKRIALQQELGEQGFGIHIAETDGIYLDNLELSNFWGDGLLTWKGTKKLNIGHLESHHNRRQGISICEVDGFTAQRLHLHDIRGTNPSAGLDIEPEPGQLLKGIYIENLITNDNYYSGFHMDLQNKPIETVDIIIKTHIDKKSAYGFTCSYNKDYDLKGTFKILESFYYENVLSAVNIYSWWKTSFYIVIDKLYIYNAFTRLGVEGRSAINIDIFAWNTSTLNSGKFSINHLTVEDDRSTSRIENIIKVWSNKQSTGFEDLFIGEITVFGFAHQYNETLFDFQNIKNLLIENTHSLKTILDKGTVVNTSDVNIDNSFYSPIFENTVDINFHVDKWRTDKLPIGTKILISPRTNGLTSLSMEKSLNLFPYTKVVGQLDLKIKRTGKGGDITITKISTDEWIATGNTNLWEVY